MRILILGIICFACCSFAQTQGLLSSMKIATFAIDSYENGWQGDWPRGIAAANALYDKMKSSIESKYSIPVSRLKEENSSARKATFLSSTTDNYNFVYYHGHGNVNRITFWGNNERVYNTQKSFGSDQTYWVFINSCLVFRNGQSDQDPWFNGVHSILGFSSESWTFRNSYSCGFLWLRTCYEKSEEMEDDFAKRWINNGEGIWEAYRIAVLHQIYEDGGYGVEPKIVYRYGYVNGVFFDPWEETFANAYRGPVFRNNYSGIGSRWQTMGTPSF